MTLRVSDYVICPTCKKPKAVVACVRELREYGGSSECYSLSCLQVKLGCGHGFRISDNEVEVM
jgi:hypothetical protein